MTTEQAVKVLIQAAELAQSKGVYSLEDATIIATAKNSLLNEFEEKKEEVETNLKPVEDDN